MALITFEEFQDFLDRFAERASPPAVVDYTELARETLRKLHCWRLLYHDARPIDDPDVGQVAAALSSIASERDVEIAALREQVDFFQAQYQDEIGLNGLREERDFAIADKAALLVRLREPEIIETAARAHYNWIAGGDVNSIWESSGTDRDTHIRKMALALAVIAEKLT